MLAANWAKLRSLSYLGLRSITALFVLFSKTYSLRRKLKIRRSFAVTESEDLSHFFHRVLAPRNQRSKLLYNRLIGQVAQKVVVDDKPDYHATALDSVNSLFE